MIIEKSRSGKDFHKIPELLPQKAKSFSRFYPARRFDTSTAPNSIFLDGVKSAAQYQP
jgi:hypothetical protein